MLAELRASDVSTPNRKGQHQEVHKKKKRCAEKKQKEVCGSTYVYIYNTYIYIYIYKPVNLHMDM